MDDLRTKYWAEIAELAEASRRLGELGYVASHGGNLSFKVADDVILLTPTKVVKRGMQPVDIVAVRADGSRQFQRVGVEVQQMPAVGPGIVDDAPLGGLVLPVIRDKDRPPPRGPIGRLG